MAATEGAQLPQLLQAYGAPPEEVLAWQQLPPEAPVSTDLLLNTAYRLCSSLRAACAPLVSELVIGGSGGADLGVGPLLSEPCQTLSILDAVLARAGVETVNSCAAPLLAQLEAVTEALAVYSASKLFLPSRYLSESDSLWREQALRMPLLILVRCVGVQAFSARELLGLGRGDLATAVAIAVAVMRAPMAAIPYTGTPPVAEMQVHLWQILYQLSTPQFSAEQARYTDASNAEQLNSTPIEDLLVEHVSHAHRLTLCLIQFGALEALRHATFEPSW